MKLGMISKLETQLAHANHEAVDLLLGLLPTLLCGHKLSTKDFATSNIPPIYGKPMGIYISHGRITYYTPCPLVVLVFSD